MMRPREIMRALRRLRVETGSLACAGCGHEHNCGIHGCAIIRGAGNLIDSQRALIQALKQANDDHRDMLAARERAASPAAVDRLMESICDRCRYELEGQLDQSTRRMYDVLCRNFSAIGIPNVKKGGDGHGGDT